MNRLIKIFSVFVIIIFTISSCDYVDCPCNVTGSNNSNTNDTVRKVLLEDFTGHECVNCPAAHDLASDLHTVYGNQLITVAIHAGYFAQPDDAPWDYDFTTTVGDEISTTFNLTATPIGMINRIADGGSQLIPTGDWATKVSAQLDSLDEFPELYIYLESNYNSGSNSVAIDAEVTFFENMPAGKYNLCVMITEDGIIAPQKDNRETDGEIMDYEHNHVLRGAVNGSWGTELIDGSIIMDDIFNESFNYTLGNDWVAENCNIIAFVYYADGANQYQIIQAQEISLK